MKWINPLDDEYVTYAAFAWKVSKTEARVRLDHTIKSEGLSNPIPFDEFKEYVQVSEPLPSTEALSVSQPTSTSNFLVGLGTFIYIFGGIIGTVYSLYILSALFGTADAIIGFVLFPLVYILLPFYTLFSYGDWSLLALNYGAGITGSILTYIGHRMSETPQAKRLPKKTLSSILWFVFLCFAFLVVYGFIKDLFIMPLMFPSAPVPTAIPRAAVLPAATRTPRPKPTPTQACLLWSQVTPQMEGRQVCVYGTVYDYRENWDDYLSYLYFGRRDQFFLVSVFRWNDSPEGQCVSVDGIVELNTYKVPYIKFKDLYFCDSPSPNS